MSLLKLNLPQQLNVHLESCSGSLSVVENLQLNSLIKLALQFCYSVISGQGGCWGRKEIYGKDAKQLAISPDKTDWLVHMCVCINCYTGLLNSWCWGSQRYVWLPEAEWCKSFTHDCLFSRATIIDRPAYPLGTPKMSKPALLMPCLLAVLQVTVPGSSRHLWIRKPATPIKLSYKISTAVLLFCDIRSGGMLREERDKWKRC